jgi:hypothetical protein
LTAPVGDTIEERLLSRSIAGQQQASPRAIEQRDREHAVDAVE